MLNLPVERLPSAESGRNLAFVDPQILKQAGIRKARSSNSRPSARGACWRAQRRALRTKAGVAFV